MTHYYWICASLVHGDDKEEAVMCARCREDLDCSDYKVIGGPYKAEELKDEVEDARCCGWCMDEME